MSTGYADKLTFREDLGGQLGAKELQESPESFESKVDQLAKWVGNCKRLVIFTGAGISTATGIPDFRGPNGVWTLKHLGKPVPPPKTSFVAATPSYTHQAMVGLMDAGKLKYVVSQNVDCLHLKSGIPRHMIAELHGNCFAERCKRCGHEYIREFEIETVGFKPTGRKCTQDRCRGILRDHILDWDDALPEDELKKSEKESSDADLVICLGTSLQITPACNLPLRTLKKGGKLVIVNLQKTPKDKKASLVIHAKVDEVLRQVMQRNKLEVPSYKRCVYINLICTEEGSRDSEAIPLTLELLGVDGQACSPLLKSASFSLKSGDVELEQVEKDGRCPFQARYEVVSPGPLTVSIEIQMDDAIAKQYRHHQIVQNLDVTGVGGRKRRLCSETQHSFLVQVVDYDRMQQAAKPKEEAAEMPAKSG